MITGGQQSLATPEPLGPRNWFHADEFGCAWSGKAWSVNTAMIAAAMEQKRIVSNPFV